MKPLPVVARSVLNGLYATMTVALATFLLTSLRGFFSTSVVALLYLLPVVVCTTMWGFTAGIIASVFSFLFFNYFFLPPFHTFVVAHPQDIMAMFVFLAVAVVISNLMGRAQFRLEQIQAREREATHLYELSVALAGIKAEKEIAAVLAEHLLEIFHALRVEVIVQVDARHEAVTVVLPAGRPPAEAYKMDLPLTTNRGTLGAVHLWMRRASFSTAEKRLFQTIASQSALAIERAFLAQTETRARILEESDHLKTAILSSVSHDLRTPLASIQAAATSLYNSDVELKAEARLELQSLLVEEVDHLNQLVGNLLNMSRIEAGALKLQIQWNSIADVADTVLARLRRRVSQHQFEVDVNEDLPLVQIDTVLVEQVLINLIENSLKYALPGSRIHLCAVVEEPAWMRITVRNHGPMIPETHLEHIFDKFYSYPGRERSGSTGLGLSICKGVVEAHGGRIWAENLSDGMAFNFTLPVSQDGTLPLLAEEA